MQEKLMILKEKNNFTNKDMGLIIGITAAQYRKKEKGKSQFKLNEMFVLAKYFGKSIDDIFLPIKQQNVYKKGE